MTNTNAAISATSAGHVYFDSSRGNHQQAPLTQALNNDEKADAALFL